MPDVDLSVDPTRKRQKAKSIGGFLKSMFLNGRISGPELQEASKVLVDNNTNCNEAEVVELAKCGNSGCHRGNMHRDTISKLEKSSNATQVYSHDVPLWDADSNCQVMKEMYFNLPHEKLDDMVNRTSLEQWTSLPPNSPLQGVVDEWCDDQGLNGSQGVAAIGLWGDSATYHTRDQLVVLLFNVLSGVFNTRFILCAMGKRMMCQCGCYGRHTMDAIWTVVTWSFQCLLRGLSPTHRADGTPFADSKRVGDGARARKGAQKRKLKLRGACIQKLGD